ncbi:MAG: DUF503 domain-containing protein [Candidatus Aminicenantes bacterium]|nr:DUF503 domain-containing protein [Candidatus Aminicenantes bacterium]
MIIGFLSLEIYLPYCHSLKEKRKRLARIKDRLRKKYNVACAELDYHDKWQRSTIGFVSLNNQKKMVEKIFRALEAETQDLIDGEITRIETHFY